MVPDYSNVQLLMWYSIGWRESRNDSAALRYKRTSRPSLQYSTAEPGQARNDGRIEQHADPGDAAEEQFLFLPEVENTIVVTNQAPRYTEVMNHRAAVIADTASRKCPSTSEESSDHMARRQFLFRKQPEQNRKQNKTSIQCVNGCLVFYFRASPQACDSGQNSSCFALSRLILDDSGRNTVCAPPPPLVVVAFGGLGICIRGIQCRLAQARNPLPNPLTSSS